ncbi:MAG: two-component regulator propeller domain-containing protein [Ignavibacteriota bacterium]
MTTSEGMAFRFQNGKLSPLTFRGETTPLSQPGTYTFTIYRDPDGTLWFGTVKGLYRFHDGEPVEHARQKSVNFPVTAIYGGGKGDLWLGGRTPGLTRFRVGDGRVTRFTSKDGLFDGYPSAMLSDAKGGCGSVPRMGSGWWNEKSWTILRKDGWRASTRSATIPATG